MGHGHDHGAAARTALKWALILNGGFLVIEAAVGFVTGSLALLSDAAHMVGDVGAIGLALAAAHISRTGATPDRSYGLARAEVLGAFVNGLALIVACGFIFDSAARRLTSGPPEVDAMPVLVVGIIGLAINLGSAWFLWRAGSDNLNVRGALLHMAADALGSVGAIVAAVLLARGIYAADAVVSILIGLLVLWSTWGLLRDAGRVLLQFAPPGTDAHDVRSALLGVEGVVDVHHLHVWTLDGHRAILTAHLVCEDGTPPDTMRERAEAMLRERFEISHSTLQAESLGRCNQPGCPHDPDTATPQHDHVH